MIVLHHLASSGGTVFSKALVAQGDCLLLNEVHPYVSNVPGAAFSPTTPLDQFVTRYRQMLPDADVIRTREEFFRAQIEAVLRLANGKMLLLREWSHGDFYVSDRFASSILPLIAFSRPRSVTLLRHPVDAFLSGKTYGAWKIIGDDIDEFCRRYVKFCEFFQARPDILSLKYEDFAAAPDAFLGDVCARLGLTFNPGYMRDLNRFRLSGASGRTTYDRIVPRPRRTMSDTERNAFRASAHYARACMLGGYSPEL
jgi:hypothetical protein